MQTLRQGMTGPDVQRWQKFLIAGGFLSGDADGDFGPQTEAATSRFQTAHGLPPDGVVGSDTLAAATGFDAVVASQPSDAPAAVQGLVTTAVLTRVMPNLGSLKATAFAPFLVGAMKEFDIDTPARAAAFLAQVAHESGEFRFMEEIWGPTPAQRRYEPVSSVAQSLGNTQPGDGKRFKGRGPIQVTGRANYRVFGDALGVDLVGNPPLAATNDVGFRTAGLYWKKRGLNQLADQQLFESITRRINGGLNGLADRVRYYERAKAVLGVPALRGAPRTPDDGGGPVFSRGLDRPGEITPTATERAPRTAARKRPAARKAASKKASGRKSRAKPAASRSRTRKKPRVRKSAASTRGKRGGVAAGKRSRVRRSVGKKRSAPSRKKARSRKSVASRGRTRAKR